MLQPKRTKFRKQMKGRNRGLALAGSKVSFGEYGLKAIARGRLTARQIESARRAINRYVRRGGKIWIRIFPDKPISKKPLEVRQGKGKGNVEYWVAQIQPGKVLYEIEGVTEEILDFADETLAIPMYGFTQSFNVSVAAAICLYDLKQKLIQNNIPHLLSEEKRNELRLRWAINSAKSGQNIFDKYCRDHQIEIF